MTTTEDQARADAIRAARTGAGMSVQAVADVVGIDPVRLAAIESARVVPTIPEMLGIAAAAGVRFSQVTGRGDAGTRAVILCPNAPGGTAMEAELRFFHALDEQLAEDGITLPGSD